MVLDNLTPKECSELRRAEIERLREQDRDQARLALFDELVKALRGMQRLAQAESDEGNLYCTGCAFPPNVGHDRDCPVPAAEAVLAQAAAIEKEAKG